MSVISLFDGFFLILILCLDPCWGMVSSWEQEIKIQRADYNVRDPTEG